MTDSTNAKTADSKLPTHFAYQVTERSGNDAFWNRIGSAWTHADGQGFNIQIEALPLSGRITLRTASEAKK
jgi:hypothetical protein